MDQVIPLFSQPPLHPIEPFTILLPTPGFPYLSKEKNPPCPSHYYAVLTIIQTSPTPSVHYILGSH